ncbi:hypothetical protein Bbelb_336880 [Branchiostoma belcheri]|nr:hypothetical protein Bbelb_336880 [Branchiostoma belcheri]
MGKSNTQHYQRTSPLLVVTTTVPLTHCVPAARDDATFALVVDPGRRFTNSVYTCWYSTFTEGKRINPAVEKRATRKARPTTSNTPTHWCSTCERGFLARIGLNSHLRIHQK